MKEIPKNWTEVGIEETLLPFENGQTLRQGWSPQCERFPAQTENDWGVLKTTAIQDGEFQPEHNKQLPTALEPDPILEVEVGDLLLTCAGPRVRCGVICLVRKTRKRLMISGKMYRFRTEPKITLATYLEAFLRSHDTKKRIDEMKTGISDSGLNLTLARFKTLQVPIPPLAEQRRIVTKIEELLSELDKGIENLKLAQTQLTVYRQALLKHAFEGKLTAAWRKKNSKNLESADQLLARIRTEREARYERQLVEWEKNSGEWKKNGRGVKPIKPAKPESQAEILTDQRKLLPQIPETWTYLRLGEVIDEPAYGTSKKCAYEIAGIGVLRIPNVVAGAIDATDLKFAEFTPEEIQSYALQFGDLLMIRSNGSVSIVGRCAQIKEAHTHLLYAGYLIRLRPHSTAIDPTFLHQQISSHALRSQIEKTAKSTSGVNNINSGEIRSLVIAVCSVAEQREIMGQIEQNLAVINSLESDIETNLQKAEALRQSILKKAFAGGLVTQDPADEPAAVLLDRIRAERVARAESEEAKSKSNSKPKKIRTAKV